MGVQQENDLMIQQIEKDIEDEIERERKNSLTYLREVDELANE